LVVQDRAMATLLNAQRDNVQPTPAYALLPVLKSSIHLTKNNINAPNSRYDISEQTAFDHDRQSLQVCERWSTDVHPIGFGTAIADDIVGKLTFGRLGTYKHIPLRWAISFRV